MIIECINIGSNKLITKGNEYEVISETKDRYSILNDKGIQKRYSKNLFKNFNQEEEIAEINEINVETSVDVVVDEITFNVTIEIEGFDNFEYDKKVAVLLDSQISCGIKQISGLNEIMQFSHDIREKFNEYVSENLIKINKDFDLEELFKETTECLFQDLLSEIEGTCLYVLLSTNLSGNENYHQDVVSVLNDLSENDSFIGENPNSGNNIKLWIIKCN